MITVTKNVDLNDGVVNTFDAWEPCAAVAFNTAIYTGNWFAAYSENGGDTFVALNPEGLCNAWGESLCCDQVVIYVPQIDQFAWIMQTKTGNYVLALASPAEVRDSKGQLWTTWLIAASRFGAKDEQVDFPELAVGDHFLYLTFNLLSAGHSIALRLSLEELRERQGVHLIYLSAPNGNLRAIQNTGDTGYFAAQNSASELRIFAWPETSNVITYFDVGIATIPTEDWIVKTPSKVDWLAPNSKIDWRILGGTRSGTQLWLAWNAARKVPDHTANSFNYPHIEIAIIDIVNLQLVEQRYIWNPEFAFAWPSLATNGYGDVGLSFNYGGGSRYPQYGVAILTGPDQAYVACTTGSTVGAGGHYVSARAAHPSRASFCGAGFNQFPDKSGTMSISHPHFVLFGVSQAPRIEVHTERHQLGAWIHVYGTGFTPNRGVSLYAEGLAGMVGRLGIGRVSTAADGSFNNFVYDARCRSGQTELVTVRGIDDATTGRMATDTTGGFIC